MIKKYISGPFLTNTYIVTKGLDCVIVDPGLGFQSYAQEINETYHVRGILLTHGHVDHIDAIANFNCPIYISKEEKDLLMDPSLALYPLTGKKPSYQMDKLDIHYVSDQDIIAFPMMEFKMILTPGHTKGSCCYLYYDKLFSGDTLFNGSQGRTDFPTGNASLLVNSLRKLMKLPDNTTVYPGHDEKTTIKFERHYNPFVLKALGKN